MKEQLRSQLLELRRSDDARRGDLMESGDLFDGYSDEMEAVHVANAEALEQIIQEHGWPGRSLVGHEAAEAAWLIAQHAISQPEVQRRCLDHLATAVAAGESPAWQLAYLTDRIRVNAQRPQVFGTQFDWDQAGELSPSPIEAAGEVDKRRAEVGLVPLAGAVELARQRARTEGHEPPVDSAASSNLLKKWAQRVGWIE